MAHLGVGEVVALVVVESEAKSAFILTEMIAHEVGVFSQVDRF